MSTGELNNINRPEPFDVSLLPSLEQLRELPRRAEEAEERQRRERLINQIEAIQSEIDAKTTKMAELRYEIEHGIHEEDWIQILPSCQWVKENDPRAIEYVAECRKNVLTHLSDIELNETAPTAIEYDDDYDSETPSYRRNSFRASVAKRAGMYIIGSTVISPCLDYYGRETGQPLERSSTTFISDQLDYPLMLDGIDPAKTTDRLAFENAEIDSWTENVDFVGELSEKFIASQVANRIVSLLTGHEPQPEIQDNGRASSHYYIAKRFIPISNGFEIILWAEYRREIAGYEVRLDMSSTGVTLRHDDITSEEYSIQLNTLNASYPPDWRKHGARKARALVEKAITVLEMNDNNG